MERAEFLERFKARLIAIVGPTYGEEGGGPPYASTAEYADMAGPTYWDDPAQREEGPEACAEDDFAEWE